MRHPALAIDPAGDALLAYNSATAKIHLNLRGAISIARRGAGGAFSTPVTVDDAASSAPAVAMGSDGSGIVAWTHDRRVYVVSVAPDGTIGRVKGLPPRAASGASSPRRPATGPPPSPGRATARSRVARRVPATTCAR